MRHLDNMTFDVWYPHADNIPQQMAYESKADILGYGGAAGGGKTDLLLGTAFTQHTKSRIFRRLYGDLDDLVLRGDEIQNDNCSFIWGMKKRWETLDNRIIQVAAVQYDKDLSKYKGRPADFIGIDEAVDFPEKYVRFVTGWLRTTIKGQRTRVILTFNPPTDPSGEWVIQFFSAWLNPDDPNYPMPHGELLWYIRYKDSDVQVENSEPVEIEDEIYYPQSRTFIGAKVKDNPYLMHDRQYLTQLDNLPEPFRTQLKDGDFTITTSDDRWQVIPTEWILLAQARGRVQGKPSHLKLRSVGVDPARGGKDDFVIVKRYGNFFYEPIITAGVKTTDGVIGASLVLDNIELKSNPTIVVDVIGIGSSVYDNLGGNHNQNIIAINVGAGSSATTKDGKYDFINLRAEIWWKFREALDPNSGEQIALPASRRLLQELRTPRYKRVGSKIQVELKEDIRKRLHHSTDVADALLLAWYDESEPDYGIGIGF